MTKYQALKRRIDKLGGRPPEKQITVSLVGPAAVDRLALYFGLFFGRYPAPLDQPRQDIDLDNIPLDLEGVEIDGAGVAWPDLITDNFSLSYRYAGRAFGDLEDLLAFRGRHG